ncbi:MAG: dihydrofolate reductase [Kiritimatiellia bacterium]
MKKPTVILIAALDRNRVIGKQNALPWRLSADLKNFKQLTLGYPILMGRKTWESIGRPLPGRRNLVMTRQQDFQAPGIQVVHSLEEALERVADRDRLYVIGGEEIYALCFPQALRMFLTHVDAEVEGGDAFFPAWDPEAFHCIAEQSFRADEKNQFDFRIVEYAKKNPIV